MGTAQGEIELEGHTLVIKRIRVTYSGFTFTEDQRATIERVLTIHADACPVARSLKGAIEIATSLGEVGPAGKP